MNSKIFKIFLTTLSSVVLLSGIALYQEVKRNDGKLHVVFCDVGQGDSILIRTPEGTDIVIDGGPNDALLACLGRYLPFWDRKIELVLLSHPHADHYTGFLSLLKSYVIGSFATEDLSNTTEGFKQLEKALTALQKKKQILFAGANIKTKEGITLSVLAPTKSFITDTSPHGRVGESKEFASLIILLEYGEHSFLFTGDSQDTELGEAARRSGSVTVLQLPHHGSKTGVSKNTLAKLSPQLGLISVGKNKYGHPTKEVLSLLQEQGVAVLRTDKNGTIDISSDGKTFSISKER